MAVGTLTLTVDELNNVLVAFNGTPSTMPTLYQNNTLNLQIQFVVPQTTSVPTGSSTALTYAVQNMAGYGLRVAIGPKPNAEPGVTPIALQTAMVYDNVNNWFTGTLSLNTQAVDDFIGGAFSVTAYFELNFTLSGTRITVLQVPFSLNSVVDAATGVVPSPVASYLTATETQAEFVPRQMEKGGTITIPSENGQFAVEIGCNDDGTVKMNIIQGSF